METGRLYSPLQLRQELPEVVPPSLGHLEATRRQREIVSTLRQHFSPYSNWISEHSAITCPTCLQNAHAFTFFRSVPAVCGCTFCAGAAASCVGTVRASCTGGCTIRVSCTGGDASHTGVPCWETESNPRQSTGVVRPLPLWKSSDPGADGTGVKDTPFPPFPFMASRWLQVRGSVFS